MKKKIVMYLLCMIMSASVFAGCGQTDSSQNVSNESEEDEDDEDDVEDEDDDSDDKEEQDDEEAVKPDEKPEKPVADKPETSYSEEEAIPRSDAYDMFLAGEMDVEVIWNDDDYHSPEAGTYSYDSLVDAIMGENPGSYDVKYAIFTPDSCSEGEDVLALYMENHDPSFYSWIGCIAYSDGKLQMRYSDTFGYRSFLDMYYDGYVTFGGSGGAGAHYLNCDMIMSDSAAYPVYRSAVLDSSWCDEASYYLDPDMAYEDRPHLTSESQLHMTVVDNMGMYIKISVSGWSSNTAIKAEEEAFVAALEELGAKIVDESETVFENEVHIDEAHAMTWIDKETVTQ